MAKTKPEVGTGSDKPGKADSYIGNLNKTLLAVLALIIISLSAMASSLLPSAVGPKPVPSASSLYFRFDTSPQVSKLNVVENLSLRGPSKADLLLEAWGNVEQTKMLTWHLKAYDFHGRLCGNMVGNTQIKNVSARGGDYLLINGEVPQPTPSVLGGQWVAYFELCWSDFGSPGSLDGPYLSSLIPIFGFSQNLASSNLTRELTIGGFTGASNLDQYSIQAGPSPTTMWPSTWEWDNVNPYTPTVIFGANLDGIQNESNKVFIAGILFGIMGGAVIALIQELAAPVKRRRENGAPR